VTGEIATVLVSAEQLSERVDELARQISADYAGKELLLVGVLKGAVFFLADLARRLTVPCTLDFMAVSSYGSSTDPSGVVRILKDLDSEIEGRHVLIVEDIVDTGQTARFLIDMVRAEGPAAMTFVTLLNKQARRKVHIEPDLVGFEVADRFVVGYGLDYAGLFRSLPDVCALPRWAEDAWPEGTPPGERRT